MPLWLSLTPTLISIQQNLSLALLPHVHTPGDAFLGVYLFFPPFSCIVCRICINLCPTLGEWNNEVDLFCSAAPSSGYGSVVLKTPGPPEGDVEDYFPLLFLSLLLCRENICSSATHSLLNVQSQPNS